MGNTLGNEMLYLVENPKWEGGMIAVFRNKGTAYYNYGNLGYVDRGVAHRMVDAGIAQWDSRDGVSPNAKLRGFTQTP